MASEDDVRDNKQINPLQMGTASVDQLTKQISDELNHRDDHHDTDGGAADDQDE